MAFLSRDSGEGAISMGPMVAVYDAGSVGEARAIIALLESHEIPALLNAEVEGMLFPIDPRGGRTRVLVPSKMLSEAQELLERPRPPATFPERLTDRGGEGEESSGALPSNALGRTRSASAGEGTPWDARFEEDEEAIDLVLPDSGPVVPRLVFALLVIALATGVQRALELAMSTGRVLEMFAVRAPILDESWRLVTGGMLHTSPEHFIGNAAFGVLLGVVLIGTHRIGATALVWLSSSIVGLATEAALSPGWVLVAGASAGNYGLVGLWTKGQLDRARLSLLPRRELIRTIGILLLLAPGALTPISATGTKIAVLAHLGGFLAGFLLGFLFKRQLVEGERTAIRTRSRAAFFVAVAIFLAGLAAAVRAHVGGPL